MGSNRDYSVGWKFNGDASGFQKAATVVKGSATAMKRDIKETSGILDEIGGSIGGVAGEISGAISALVTAAGPIGAIVVIVGALAKAWKNSQENIDLYLKSADKLAIGAAGFTVDAEKARVDVRKRANGMISEGYKIEKEYSSKIFQFGFLYTEEQKKQFTILIAQGKEMQKQGRILRDSVIGARDKADWQIKYNELLQEEERLNDKSLANKTKWEGLEAQLVEQKTLIQDKDTDAKIKAEAVVKATEIANQLLKEKNTFIDEQLKNVRDMAEMTATQEVVEDKIAGLEREKATNMKEYSTDMLKVLRMESKVTKEKEKQSELAKFINIGIGAKNMTGKFGGSFAARPEGSLATTPGAYIDEVSDSLGVAQTAVVNLAGALGDMFRSTGEGWKGMLNTLRQSINALLGELIAKAAIFGILQLIFPGSAVAAGALTNLRKFVGIPGYASGTNFAPGGLSVVGENGPEMINLPRGSRVTPGIGGNINIVGRTQISDRHLYILWERYANKLYNNT